MFILINGPLGVGKSSLGEALSERIEGCVHLDGDRLVAVNPEPADTRELLHSTVGLLVTHFRDAGYEHFVINHFWESPEALGDLTARLEQIDPDAPLRCFLATLSLDENIARIERRQAGRAIDELEFEREILWSEREALERWRNGEVGKHFSVADTIGQLVGQLLATLADDLDRPV